MTRRMVERVWALMVFGTVLGGLLLILMMALLTWLAVLGSVGMV